MKGRGKTKVAPKQCSIEGCNKIVDARGYCPAHYTRWKKHGCPHVGGPVRTKTQKGDPLSWLANAVKSMSDECILWPYGVGKWGYGLVRYEGKQSNAHRVALILYTGKEPEGMHACHEPIICHNRLCVNPKHIRWGTPSSNTNDQFKDETNNAKLSEGEVKKIRNRYAGGEKQTEIAKEYGMHSSQISRVCSRDAWRHVK